MKFANSIKKYYLSLFFDNEFYEWVYQQTHKYLPYFQKENIDSKWEGTNIKEIQACIGIMIYIGLT
jgi:hypothetical protein